MAKKSMKHVYGWRRSLPDRRDRKIGHLELAALPKSIDLRFEMPPVYDQGELGSCTANAIAGAIEHQYIKQKLDVVTPSRLFIYYNERALEGTVDSDSGAEIRDGIKTVVKYGDCPETEWPYDVSKFKDKPSAGCYVDAAKNVVEDYTNLGQNLVTLKSMLSKHYSIAFGITVYESFESEAVEETGIVPMPKPNEECLGGHAVLIVGYDDYKNAFLVRNSWGSDWGVQGYFYLPYDYVLNPDLASDFWIIQLVK